MSSRSCCCSVLGLSIFLALVSVCHAEVSFRILEADANTPFDGRPIMVGTQLTIVISSDSKTTLSGGFFIKDSELVRANLVNARYLPASGLMAYILNDMPYPPLFGCQLYAGPSRSVSIGDWFVVDYIATEVGDCNVGLYEDDYVTGGFALLGSEYTFTHVKSRDFNADGRVDFVDFAKLAEHWQTSNCLGDCQTYDLDDNGFIDNLDIALFAEYWLARTF